MSRCLEATLTLRIILLHLVAPVARGNENCNWSECRDKVSSALFSCASGFKRTDNRDCGTCFLGVCSHEEIQCCQGPNACAWYDATCNWENMKDNIFEDGIDPGLKEQWSDLSTTLKEKLRTVEGFRSLNRSEIMNLPFPLLAELKSLEGMTGDQIKFVFTNFKDNMTETAFRDMMKNINASMFGQDDVISNITHLKHDWTPAQIELIQAKLRDAWGPHSQWNSSNINSLDSLISAYNKSVLTSFNLEQLLLANNFDELLPAQFSDLNRTDFEMIVRKLQNETFMHTLPHWTKGDRNWGPEEVRAVVEKLQQVRGDPSTWNASMIEMLGNMIPGIAPELLSKFNLTDLANSDKVDKFNAMQVMAMFAKLQEMNDTSFSLLLAGMNDTSFEELLQNLTMENFTKAVPQWGRYERVWRTTKVMAIFQKLQQDDAWGNAAGWNATAISMFGTLMSEIDPSAMEHFNLTELSHSDMRVLKALRGKQLTNLWPKLQAINDTDFNTLVEKLADDAVGDAVMEWGKFNQTIDFEKVLAISHKLQNAQAWGNATNWNATLISSLGDMLGGLDLPTLLNLDGNELANATNLRMLRAAKLIAMKQKFLDMDTSSFQHTVAHLDPAEIKEAIAHWGSGNAWAEDKAKAIGARLEQVTLWGSANDWNASRISSLGNLISGLGNETLAKIQDRELVLAENLKNLTESQVGDMAQKLKNMNKADFESMLSNISKEAFTGAIEDWGQTTWPDDRVEIIVNALQENAAWGNATSWTYDQAQRLGSMLNNLPESVNATVLSLTPEPTVTTTDAGTSDGTTAPSSADGANRVDLNMAIITLATVAMAGLMVTSAL